MELPKQNGGEYEHARKRIELNKSLREWRELRRAQRLGRASYRDVHQAHRAYKKTLHRTEAVFNPEKAEAERAALPQEVAQAPKPASSRWRFWW